MTDTTDLQKPFSDADLRSFAGHAIYPVGSVPNRLAARVLELEAENKRLRKEMQIVIDDCEADNPPSHGAIKHGLRTALKGGEI